jgi:hypothetical protein
MAKQDYNRYEILKNNDGTMDMMPFVNIPTNSTDKYEEWITGKSRMDKLSNKYYNTPFFDFLILYANPLYISEWEIPDSAIIRIPFPLSKAKNDYETELKRIKNL